MTKNDQQRLAQIRMHNAMASAEYDTTFWESTFFIRLHDEQNKTIEILRRELLNARK